MWWDQSIVALINYFYVGHINYFYVGHMSAARQTIYWYNELITF